MSARLAIDRYPLDKLGGRRLQERSTWIAPIALYSAQMRHLGGNLQGRFRLSETASVAFHATLCRLRPAHHPPSRGFGSIQNT